MRIPFPGDRSLLPSPSEPLWLERRVPAGSGAALTHPEASIWPRRLAFASLLIYARMLQQPRLTLATHFSSEAPATRLRHADWTLDETHSLHQSAQSLVWVDTPGPDAPTLDLLLCFGHPGAHPMAGQAASGPPGDAPLLLMLELEEGDDATLCLHLRYDPAQIATVSAQDLLDKLMLVCQALQEQPEQPLRTLELRSLAATHLLANPALPLWPQPQPRTPDVLREVARHHWAEPAVSGRGGVYTYGALWTQAGSLARQLVQAGLQPGELVVIAGMSSFGAMASMWATLLAGGVIVTLDQSLPAERQARILVLCQPRIILAVQSAQGQPGEWGDAQVIQVADWPAQGHAPARATWQDIPAGPSLAEDAPAYVFFTSGSTGEPKGVLGSARGLDHFLHWQRSQFPIGPGDRSAQLTAFSFDVVLRDIFFPLTSGACLCIPERESLFDARRILKWMADQRITVMHSVPSLMKAWLQAGTADRPFRAIRYIFFAGEPLTDALLTGFREAASPEAQITNLYGPTETTLAKFYNRVDQPEPGVQPVGCPQPGVQALVMRERSVRCGLWEIGEIVIRTPYRSHGYLRQEALTREVFQPNPWRQAPDDLLYFTGDLGRVRPDGKLEIFGRIDAQIKIRGVRIEPNEIEAELLRVDGVKDAAVSTRVNAREEKTLVAFLTLRQPAGGAEAEAAWSAQVRTHLRSRMHDAMVPSRYVFVDALPYLPNGKLNRKAIAALDVAAVAEAPGPDERRAAAAAPRPACVAEIENALGRPIEHLDQSFVDLGGDSLSYIRVSLVLEDVLGTLPTDWPERPLRDLLARAPSRPAATGWVSIELPLLLRALSILLVVLNHTGVTDLLGTSVLFVVSGLSFGKFLRPAIFQTGSLQGVLRFVLRYGVPAALWQGLRSVAFHRFWLPDLILLGTLFQPPGNGHWTLWYLDVMTANLLLLSGLAWLELKRGLPSTPQQRLGRDVCVVLAGMALAALQATTGWWDGELGVSSVGPFRWFWLMAFGVAISQVAARSHRLWLTALLAIPLVLGALPLGAGGKTFGFLDPLFYLAMVPLLWIDAVRIPRLLKGAVVQVASASLFIYIFNVTVINHLLPSHGSAGWWVVQTLAALLVGVVAERVWGRLLALWPQRVFGRWRWLGKAKPQPESPSV